MKKLLNHRVFAVATGLCTIVATSMGCRDANSVPMASHEPNYLFSKAMEIKEEVELNDSLLQTKDLLTQWFGTLHDPKIPELLKDGDYSDLFTEENLKLAAGTATNPGLYASQQCVSCHGHSGQGRGSVAASQDPYPRDFRAGIFKFKGTPLAAKPRKEDIARVLKQGLSGTQMPIFDKLSDEQIQALVDYVVYLSIRGDVERRLLRTASSNDGKMDDIKDAAEEALTQVADRWIAAEDSFEEFPTPEITLVGAVASDDAALAQSIEKGKELFRTTNCAQCHGLEANGIGTKPPDYDNWTKEWTVDINIAPTNVDELLPLMALGGMKPQIIKPRNIVEGHLRGGRDPMDIYRRIRYGIPGGPMPAAAIVQSREEQGLLEEDLWHLVNYVLSIAQVPPPPVSAQPDGQPNGKPDGQSDGQKVAQTTP